jgi:hypothetical protein
MPISITAARCVSRSPSRVSGRPMSLLRLPRVASTASALPPKCARRIAAHISLTVVLPLLPVMPSSGIGKRARQAAASWPSARRVSFTATSGNPGLAAAQAAFDHGAGGALGQHFGDEVVAIEALALERDEQHAGCHRARIAADRGELDISAQVRHTKCGASLGKPHH